MPGTTPRGYTYATADDPNDLALISQRLAEQIDGDVGALALALAALTPAGRIVRNQGQTIPSGTWTEISAWSVESFRRGGMVYTAPRFVVPRDGLYLFTCMAAFSGNATGRRGIGPTVDGATNFSTTGDQSVGFAGTAAGLNQTTSAVISLAAGQAIGLQVYQDTGNPLALNTCQMGLALIGN